MSGNIRAIETVYNGYKFRSRLEAKWAVFFDAVGIKYDEYYSRFVKGIWKVPGVPDNKVIEAVKKARSARFEFGETPKP